MIIQFIAPFLDHSGYGEASRNTLMAMHQVGINVTTKIVSFTKDKLNVGFAGSLARKLEKKYKNYNINLIELTPEHFPLFLEPGKYNIGYFFWEVKGLDQKWVNWCNLLDEIWLPSPVFAKMFINGGVHKPVRIVPCCMDMNVKKYQPFELNIPEKPKITFYSIFQWTERKNPKALLTAYWKAFQKEEDVLLIIKTYRSDFSEKEQQEIKKQIIGWKNGLKLKNYPRVGLVLKDQSYDDIMRLHATADVFVSTHRGEGWGYSQMNAMAFGNLIISTNFGGIHEYLPKGTVILLDYVFKNLWGMDHIEWYNKRQQWADVDVKDLQEAFSWVYKADLKNKKMAVLGQAYVKNRFNYRKVGLELKLLLEKRTS